MGLLGEKGFRNWCSGCFWGLGTRNPEAETIGPDSVSLAVPAACSSPHPGYTPTCPARAPMLHKAPEPLSSRNPEALHAYIASRPP